MCEGVCECVCVCVCVCVCARACVEIKIEIRLMKSGQNLISKPSNSLVSLATTRLGGVRGNGRSQWLPPHSHKSQRHRVKQLRSVCVRACVCVCVSISQNIGYSLQLIMIKLTFRTLST